MRKLRNTQNTFSRFDTERREVIKAIRSVYYRHTSETSDGLQREQLCDHDPFFVPDLHGRTLQSGRLISK